MVGVLTASLTASVDGVRTLLANEYLERTNMNIDQVAERTTFFGVSNFRKAFKRWTGQSLGYYRKSKP